MEFQTREIWEQYDPNGESWDREAQFVHQSVADYVLEKFLNCIGHCQRPQVQIGAGHFEISRSCLRYMTLKDVLEGAAKLSRGLLSATFPLAPYVVRFLFHRNRKVEREGVPQSDLLPVLHWKQQSESLKNIEALWKILDPDSAHTPIGWPFMKATPLHVLVAFGSKSAVDAILQQELDSWNLARICSVPAPPVAIMVSI